MSQSTSEPLSIELLRDLAAASRILASQGVVDGFGHVSMRHPTNPKRYFMSCSKPPALVTPEDILEYDLDSVAIDPQGRKSCLERFIHGEIYKARPDIGSDVHSHSPSVVPFGLVRVKMQAMYHNPAYLAKEPPIFDISEKFGDTDMLVGDIPKGVELAQVMGPRDVVMMRAHGSVACGPTLQTAVFRAVYTEVNARIQHMSLALAQGQPIAALSAKEGELADEVNQGAGLRAWDLWRTQVRDELHW